MSFEKYHYIDKDGCPRNKCDDSYLVQTGQIWKYIYPSGKYYYCLPLAHCDQNLTGMVTMSKSGMRILLIAPDYGFKYLGQEMMKSAWKWVYVGDMDSFSVSGLPETHWIHERNYKLDDEL